MGKQIILSGANFSAANLSLNWLPTQLGANLAAWFKADKGVTSASGAVSQIVGQSPNALTLTQSVSANQPTLTANAQNGLPGIASSSTTAQVLASAVAPSAVQFDYNKPFSVALVFKRVGSSPFNGGSGSWESIIGCLDPATSYRGWFLGGSKPEGSTVTFGLSNNGPSGSNAIVVHGPTALVTGQTYIVIVTYDGSAKAAGVNMYVQNVAQTLATANDTLTATTISANQQLSLLGAPNEIGGFQSIDQFLEAFVVNRVLTSSEVTFASEYLDSRWAAY